ncbi:MAG: glycosyltransferase, partial [Tidjanibacter sp.]|nr:glycosyltransferase [Tidjanibacter sp.]
MERYGAHKKPRNDGKQTLLERATLWFMVQTRRISVKKLVDSEKFDIIHSHGARGNFMSALLKRHARLPLLTTVHSD